MLITEKSEAKKSASAREKRKESPIMSPVEEAVNFTVPSWPLQNTVAVNPFWNLRDKYFFDVMQDIGSIIHAKPYMPLEYYLEKYQAGAISEQSLAFALATNRHRINAKVQTPDDFIQASKVDRDLIKRSMIFAEFYDQEQAGDSRSSIALHLSKYAAAYFDEAQAVARFPWHKDSFWKAWTSAQEFDRSMDVAITRGFAKRVQCFADMEARDFIAFALKSIGLQDDDSQARYLSRLLASSFGWSSQFRYCEWQKSLGYSDVKNAETTDFLAVLLAYDFVLFESVREQNERICAVWKDSLNAFPSADEARVHPFELHEIWQTAFEMSYQTTLCKQLNFETKTLSKAPTFQIAMCIDVRSEMARRALEKSCEHIETIGFAGFFGVPIDYQKIDEKTHSHRLPVLLTPAFKIKDKEGLQTQRVFQKALSHAFFRNLRKAPLASFAYVELFGIYSVFKMLAKTFSSAMPRQTTSSIPKRFSAQGSGLDNKNPILSSGDIIELNGKVDRAAAVLAHMGLKDRLARLVLLAGHGSANTNNAFMSALDCGACGGHAGDINARFLADLLNDPDVRQGLSSRNIHIPKTTWFVAAVHETVTDQVYLLDKEAIPKTHEEDLRKLEIALISAGELTRHERQTSRSAYFSHSAMRRSESWSETRPEWGLAGNAAFIVAPRALTKGVNLNSRTFLHDYSSSKDEGFATLELIMTAPMVVTNWINMQYYASTVAPDFYGSGNKVIHNLVNESGVQEGNGGDLRVGLPFQSVHDGEKFIHEPLRLSVYIAAPKSAIEDIISRHAAVRHLIDNAWLHLLHIDETSGAVSRRIAADFYFEVDTTDSGKSA